MKCIQLTQPEIAHLKKNFPDLYSVIYYIESRFNAQNFVICEIIINGHDVSNFEPEELKKIDSRNIQTITLKIEKSEKVAHETLKTLIEQLDNWIFQLENFEPRSIKEIHLMGNSVFPIFAFLNKSLTYLLVWLSSEKKHLVPQFESIIKDFQQQIKNIPKFESWMNSQEIWFWLENQVLFDFKLLRFELNKLWNELHCSQNYRIN